MPRRRKKPAKYSAKDVREARALIHSAFKKRGRERKEASAEIRGKVRKRMAAFVKDRFIKVDTKAEARRITSRLSLAGAAHKVAQSEARAAFVRDRSGRWHKRSTGAFVSAANMKRSQGVRAYWNQVKIIREALKITTAEARKAYRVGGGEKGWRETVGTP